MSHSSTEDRALRTSWTPPPGLQDRTVAAMRVVYRSVAKGASLSHAAKTAGVTRTTVTEWRNRYPEFKEATDKCIVREKMRKQELRAGIGTVIYDPDRVGPPKPGLTEFRTRYLGRPTPDHQTPFIEALEDRTNQVIIALMPPGAGKDTLVGDYLLWEFADDRSGLRAAWIMESENFAKRRLQRLLRYLTDPLVYKAAPPNTPGAAKPASDLIADYGPWRWEKGMVYPDGRKVERPEWTKLQAYFVQSVAPEADPNLWATGIGGATYGSRMDLAVLSDAFTTENQKSPTMRADQMVWLEGTLDTRLDEKGRLVVIGTELPLENNYDLLIERYTRNARVVSTDGRYTKYSNGTAVIRVAAVGYDDDGQEVSYWPERFPLDAQIIEKATGTVHSVVDLTPDVEDELLSRPGTERIRGLRERRQRNPEQFEAMYNQNRIADSVGDFTDVVLNAADDRDRTIGRHLPGEIIVVGVDPARVYGAAWVAWAINRAAKTITLLDCFYGTRLGVEGIKNKLVLAPLTRYQPLWLCYEVNTAAAILEDWHVAQAITDYAVNVYRHPTTHVNRGSLTVGPASLAPYMRTGVIRWPMRTMDDQRRVDLVKAHFKAWDRSTLSAGAGGRTRPGKSNHQPDDLAMAAWVGFIKARELLERADVNRRLPKMPVPEAVRRRWRQFQADGDERAALRNADKQQVTVSNIMNMVMGGSE